MPFCVRGGSAEEFVNQKLIGPRYLGSTLATSTEVPLPPPYLAGYQSTVQAMYSFRCNGVAASSVQCLAVLWIAAGRVLAEATVHREACQPKLCRTGGLEVEYPFWIRERHPEYCGVPGFGLTCHNATGDLLLKLSGEEYTVKNISYDLNRETILLTKTPSLGTGNCSFPTPALSYAYEFRFHMSKANNKLLYINCSEAVQDASGYFHLRCKGKDGTSQDLYLTDNRMIGHHQPLQGDDCQFSTVTYSSAKDPMAVLQGKGYEGLMAYGFLMEWNAPLCLPDCSATGGRCGFRSDINKTACICEDSLQTSSCAPSRAVFTSRKGLLIAYLVASFVLLSSLTAAFYFYMKTCKRVATKETSMVGQSVETLLEMHGALAVRRYKYHELKTITNSFTEKLGKGGCGTVYKGRLPDGVLVAVKVLSDSDESSGEVFINEVASIGRTNHINIVSLLGFCYQGRRRALVYEFMHNGSLEKFLFQNNLNTTSPLGWDRLYNIAVGIARGLEYLHKGCKTRIVHFDIKPHNILLDEDFCPKISDFGLAKLIPPKESNLSMVCARGTIGYIAPEVFSRNFGSVSSKSDVYSYGMMILEMVGRRRNAKSGFNKSSEAYFPHWLYDHFEQDADLATYEVNLETQEIAKKMIIVGMCCIQINPASRPTITKVVEMLGGSLADLHMPPKPYICSPPRSDSDIVSLE